MYCHLFSVPDVEFVTDRKDLKDLRKNKSNVTSKNSTKIERVVEERPSSEPTESSYGLEASHVSIRLT